MTVIVIDYGMGNTGSVQCSVEEAGAYVELEALIDLICVVSSCPFDLGIEGWTINAPGGPTGLRVEVR